MSPILKFKNNTRIVWSPGDDGGGSTQYVDFLNAIGTEKKYSNCLEWCAGLSAIAFSLLDSGIAENFVLMDIYEPALTHAKRNAKTNNIADRVDTRLYDKIGNLPTSDKFDLVVGNPPHGPSGDWLTTSDISAEEKDTILRITVDPDWKLHKEFFQNICNYLNPNADIYLSETNIHSFIIDWAKEAGLTLMKTYPATALSKDTKTNAVIFHFRYETKIH